jgi:protease I
MTDSLNEKTIALLATDGFEDSELTRPLEAVKEAGAEVVIVSNGKDVITGKNGTEIDVDKSVDEVLADDFDGLLLPGGVHNPDVMRTEVAAVSFVRNFFELHKPVAAICHAPWLLIEADVVRGRKLTSWPSLKTDLVNAGAEWVDEEVVTDDGLVTSRKPDDLDAFCAKAIEEFAEGVHENQTA